MSENPFQGSGPDAKTVYVPRPTPGGSRPAPTGPAEPPPAVEPPRPQPPAKAAPQGTPPRTAPPRDPAPAVLAKAGGTPLIDAAMPLLLLLASLHSLSRAPDPATLRQRAIDEIRAFDTAARAAGLAAEQVHPARYILCASIDDCVLATPWGSASPWTQASLVSMFHGEVVSGEGVFLLIESVKRDPQRHLDLLTLLHLCLSLGYQGQYRLSPRGPAELDRIREELHSLLRRYRPGGESGLSPCWEGVPAPYQPPRAGLPLWAAAAAGLLLVGLAWGGGRLWLSPRAETLADRAGTLPPSQMPALDRVRLVTGPPAAPVGPDTGFSKRVRQFLQPQIDAGLVKVEQGPAATRVTIFDLGGQGMFDVGRAEVRDSFVPLLGEIGDALNDEPGQVLISGHTDNRPIHTVRFPSNYHLSVARAESAGAIVRARLQAKDRLQTVGYAAQQPCDNNDTDLGRAHNRRIEIILQQPQR